MINIKLKIVYQQHGGSKSLVLAQNILLKEALQNENNTHFIILSNSCVPFKKFNYIYDNLDKDFSYFHLFSDMSRNEAMDRIDYYYYKIDNKYFQKASQWSILNKKHANILVNAENEYIDWIETIPDESSYITYLFYMNLQNELKLVKNSKYEATTFTNWFDELKLKNYDYISDDELYSIYNSKCFFGRKFTKDCKLDTLFNMLL